MPKMFWEFRKRFSEDFEKDLVIPPFVATKENVMFFTKINLHETATIVWYF